MTARRSGYESAGCQGGLSEEVFDWAATRNVTTEARYPYTSGGSGKAGACHAGLLRATQPGQAVRLASAKNSQVLPAKSEDALKAVGAGWRGRGRGVGWLRLT